VQEIGMKGASKSALHGKKSLVALTGKLSNQIWVFFLKRIWQFTLTEKLSSAIRSIFFSVGSDK